MNDLVQITCPIDRKPCLGKDCPYGLWTELEDWQGCSLNLGRIALEEVLKGAAGWLDRVLNRTKKD